MGSHEIPLFPLSTVLFPGGELPLQIFEPRYIDMVRECTRTETAFGVCLQLEDELAGHTIIGTSARIFDWFTRENGLLGIIARGSQRFRVLQTTARDNGLLIGRVEWLPGHPGIDLPLEFSVLSTIVARYLEQAREQFPDAKPDQLEDAEFISWRLAELLPVSDAEKQHILELEDVFERLTILQNALPRFQK